MRLVPMIFLMLLCFCLAAGHGASAANVLLPSDNSSSGAPNMGLMPAPDNEAPAPETAQSKPVDLPPESAQPTTPKLAVPAQQPAKPQTPSSTISVVSAETALWTSFDINTISKQLGISKGMVHDQCAIGLNGLMVTDHGTYTVESGTKTNANVSYDGSIINAMLSTRALCQSAPQPAPGSYLQRSGNYFVVPLGSAYCAPRSTGTYSRLLVVHGVGGKDTCSYQ